MLETATKDLDAVAASSVPYLRCFSIVAGGAMMSRMALAAQTQIGQGKGDKEFLEDKILSAVFYAGHIMPQAKGFSRSVTHGADSILKVAF